MGLPPKATAGRRGLCAAGLVLFAKPSVCSAEENCFRLLPGALADEGPFPVAAVAMMRRSFLANLNADNLGAIVASPGNTPALDSMGFKKKAYVYDWIRDGALTMLALQRLLGTDLASAGDHDQVTEAIVDKLMQAYTEHVKAIVRKDGRTYWTSRVDAHGDPKWELHSELPYTANWCRPQTDGPGLRAMALMMYANRTYFSTAMDAATTAQIWELVKFDLDWVAKNEVITMPGCDVWEETVGRSFFWNRMTMRAALLKGHLFAQRLGDYARARTYLAAVESFIGNPIRDHSRRMERLPGGIFVTGCPTDEEEWDCGNRGKDYDGSVILSFIHSDWLELPEFSKAPLSPAARPTDVAVANTVQLQTIRFCEAYPVNRNDTEQGIPGVLYGRFSADSYGGGNPWVLITAALASLFYQAAQVVGHGVALDAEQLAAWRAALAAPAFDGSTSQFVAAGDSVLVRIRRHVENTEGVEWHLYEQIDKVSGQQTNAKDLTWSYAEVLSALRERETAVKSPLLEAKPYLL